MHAYRRYRRSRRTKLRVTLNKEDARGAAVTSAYSRPHDCVAGLNYVMKLVIKQGKTSSRGFGFGARLVPTIAARDSKIV